MKQYKAYLFDFDGTLFNTVESLIPCFRYAFKAIGEDCTDEEVAEFIHHSIQEVVMMKQIPMEKWKTFGDAILESVNFKEVIEATKEFPDTYKTIKALNEKNIPVGVVSGNCESHMELVLEHFGINGLFGPLTGNESYKNPKPNAEPVLVGLRRIGAEPSHDCLYVGDSLQDIEAAQNAGVDGVLIDRNNQYPDFKGVKIHSLEELI
ncbi:MAG: HAD family hydrolase [Bacilli bacterium]|nr:HAD family hydrolase [Bacilli bacterium]